MAHTLGRAATRRFYDAFGAKQDWQSFYEDPALDALVSKAGFQEARDVLEFGCGTGRFAERLLSRELAEDARYLGTDLSVTMVELASRRLSAFGPRARTVHSDGNVMLPFPDASFDRFVSTYVLDLLGEQDIAQLLADAHRILIPRGRLCLVSLTHGQTFPSRLVSLAWAAVQSLRPGLVGGCRPIEVTDFLGETRWRRLHRVVVTAWAVPSEVLVGRVALITPIASRDTIAVLSVVASELDARVA